METHAQNQDRTRIAPPSFIMSGKAKAFFGLLVGLGLVSFLIALKTDPQRAWANYLVDYFYWLCFALFGFFFAGLQHLTGSSWSVTVRRVAEMFSRYIWVSIILFVGLLFGLHHLFEWTHSAVVQSDPILVQKISYLNEPFFVVRSAVLFLLCLTLGRWMIKNSIAQDTNPSVAISFKNNKISTAFTLIFAWAFTFVAFDLMMSLSPHWFSTIFGVYCFAGLFGSGLAMLAVWVIVLRKKGHLAGFVTDDHLHDIGKLMFGFTVFWAYIGFSQFMLIWYANLPEETFFMIRRTEGAWASVSILLAVVKFVIPFFLIVSRFAKRSENFMLFMGCWFIANQWLDIYWLVFPTFYDVPVFGWMEIGINLGFLGLFFLSVGHAFKKVSPVCIGDPRLTECLHHHQ